MVPDVDLVGVWDPDSQLAWRRASEWSEFHPDLMIFSSRDELLECAEVEAVIVDGQTRENPELARAAVNAGKHVLLEKPAGLEMSPFKRLHDAAQQAGLLVQMGYIMRYNPGFEVVRRLHGAGALGSIFSVRGRISWERASYAEQMPGIGVLPGGMLFELGCHYLDLIMILLGEPISARAYFGKHHDPSHRYTDNALACLEFGGALATIESAAMESGALQNRSFEVYGSQGTAIIQPLEPPEVLVHLDEPWGEFRAGWQTAEIDRPPRHVRDLAEFAACIRGEKTPDYSREHDLAVHRVLLEMCRADGA